MCVDVWRVQRAPVRPAAMRSCTRRDACCRARLGQRDLRTHRGEAKWRDGAVLGAVGRHHRRLLVRTRVRGYPASRLALGNLLAALTGWRWRAGGAHFLDSLVQRRVPRQSDCPAGREACVGADERHPYGERGADASAALRDGSVLQGAPRSELAALVRMGPADVHCVHVHWRWLRGRAHALPTPQPHHSRQEGRRMRLDQRARLRPLPARRPH
mmetsp:Transcript_36661/g.85639  ORF Transcript_36661/g.85639 Transcript_36661/m.85639 type:complete len:214 (+) Transcript_36661:784-1425(+)